MIEEAASQRLLRTIDVDEPDVAQTHLLRMAEQSTYKVLQAVPAGLSKADQFRLVVAAWEPFPCKLRDTFLALYAYFLCDTPTTVKEHLEAIHDVAFNNDLKRIITRDIRTASKHKSIVKNVLNLGTKTFESLFDEVGLTTVELARRDNTRLLHDATCATLDDFLLDQSFEGNENRLITSFYQEVDKLPDPETRNAYLNKFLVQLLTVVKKEGAKPSLLNLLVQVVDHLLHRELVKQPLDPQVEAWLAKNPIDFFRHSLRHMASVLPPHSNFKRAGYVLDPWQRQAVRAIQRKENLFISAPPSAGKTVLSTEAIEDNDDVWYVAAEQAPARQLAAILLASMDDQEKRKGVEARNIRLELPGTKPYRRFQRARDNILVTRAQRLWELLQAKEAPPNPHYIILDEFHNINGEQGPYYEYILKYAIFHSIPFICLGWLPNHAEASAWLAGLLPSGSPLFSINVKKRFFNQRRMVFRRPKDDGVKIAILNPLEHLNATTLRSPAFCHPGLHPTETLRLSETLVEVLPPTERRVPSLDDVDAFEARLYDHLRTLPDKTLLAILKERPVDDTALSMYQIHTILRHLDPVYKPLILFRLDPKACLGFFLQLVQFIRDKSRIVYDNFQDDQPIIKQYLEEVEAGFDDSAEDKKSSGADKDKDKSKKGSGGGDKGFDADKHDEIRRGKQEALYTSKYLPRLQQFYKAWVNPAPDPAGLAAFNAKYGGTLTHEEIVRTREKDVARQLGYTYNTIRLRRNFTIHDDVKLINQSSGDVMKTIRKQFEAELEYQRKQTGPFEDMRVHGPEFDEFNKIEETRHEKKWDRVTREWVRTKKTDTHQLTRDWPKTVADPRLVTSRDSTTEAIEYDYTYKMSYDHPVMVAAECGVFFYNELLNPALSRVCQLLIGKYANLVVADKGLGVSVNYPFASAWVQGGLRGEPAETPDPGMVNQAFGRAGRRGFDKDAWLFSNGLDVSKVLYPQFHPLTKNETAAMEPLVLSDSEAFRTFVLTETRVATAASVAATVAVPEVPATGTAATATATANATPTVVEEATDADDDWYHEYVKSVKEGTS